MIDECTRYKNNHARLDASPSLGLLSSGLCLVCCIMTDTLMATMMTWTDPVLKRGGPRGCRQPVHTAIRQPLLRWNLMREKEDHDCPLFFFYHQSLIASGDAGGRGWHLVVAAISLNSLAAIYKEIWRTDRPHTVRTVNNKNMLRFERDKKKRAWVGAFESLGIPAIRAFLLGHVAAFRLLLGVRLPPVFPAPSPSGMEVAMARAR